MPEYLAPGVYVEETSFRAKSIEGVGTSTTGFVGATRYGPTDGEPELMTSFSQFERIYGGLDSLAYEGTEQANYLAHAVRNFFDNGGSRLYISRAYESLPLPVGPAEETANEREDRAALLGRAIAAIPGPNALVGDVDTAATTASSLVLSALNTGVLTLQQSQAYVLTVLRYAVSQTFAGLTVTLPPEISYDVSDPTADVDAQIEAWISGPPPGITPEETAQFNADRSTWQAVVNQADALWQAIVQALTNSETEQANVSGAYQAGVDAGEAADLDSATAASVADLEAEILAVSSAPNSVSTTAEEISTEAVVTAIAELSTPATALTVLTDVANVVDSVSTLITQANGAIDPITSAATLATVQQGFAIENARTDWLARFPGMAGNMSVVVTGRLGGASVLMESPNGPVVTQVRNGDLVIIQRGASSALIHSAIRTNGAWSFTPATGSALALNSLDPNSDRVIPLTLTVEIFPPGKFAQNLLWDSLTVSDRTDRLRDSVTQVFGETIANRIQTLETPVILAPRTGSTLNPAQLASDLVNLSDWAALIASNQLAQSQAYELADGDDGVFPTPSLYEGQGDDSSPTKSGLKALEDLEEISIIAAPGYSLNWGLRRSEILTVSQALINHCERIRYRVAVLDSPDQLALSGVREYRALLDTTRAAVYYPWVVVNDPVTNQDIGLPPSGFVAGIYARNDVEIGVHKAPANEVVRNAISLEVLINKAQQDVLNPLGINCIRFFEGRGIRVWGARTVSSDPEWKYLNIRRYFAYLEASIDRATQWAVFQPNGEQLWDNIRRTVSGFLENEWREGRLAGAKLEEAFFVRCDRSTMTQNDLDNGRLICLIGVSPLYPAEFVIFRIGQWTADRR